MNSPASLRAMVALLALLSASCSEPAAPVPTPAYVSIREYDTQLLSGYSVVTHVSVTMADGEVVQRPALVYRSSDSLVATVDTAGKVYARAAGKAYITAAFGAAEDTLAVTVIWRPVGFLNFGNDSLVLAPGTPWKAAFTMLDTWNLVATHATPTFTTSDSTVATVEDAGWLTVTFAARVTAVKEGRAIITVTADGKRDVLPVIVKKP